MTRLSPVPSPCGPNPCASFDEVPEISATGMVVYEYQFWNLSSQGCGGWCITDSEQGIRSFSGTGASVDIPTPCDNAFIGPESPSPSPSPDGTMVAYADCEDPNASNAPA